MPCAASIAARFAQRRSTGPPRWRSGRRDIAKLVPRLRRAIGVRVPRSARAGPRVHRTRAQAEAAAPSRRARPARANRRRRTGRCRRRPSTARASPTVNRVRPSFGEPDAQRLDRSRGRAARAPVAVAGLRAATPGCFRYDARNDNASTAFSGVKKLETPPVSSASCTSRRSIAPSHAASTGFACSCATPASACAASIAEVFGRGTCSATTTSTFGIVERQRHRPGMPIGWRIAHVDRVRVGCVVGEQRIELARRAAR